MNKEEIEGFVSKMVDEQKVDFVKGKLVFTAEGLIEFLIHFQMSVAKMIVSDVKKSYPGGIICEMDVKTMEEYLESLGKKYLSEK